MYLILLYGKNCSSKTFLRRSGLDIQKLEVVYPDDDLILEDSLELQPLCKRRVDQYANVKRAKGEILGHNFKYSF